MEQEEQKLNSLPDNAYRELKPGEVYKPIMPANSKPREVTTYSVVFGIIMAIVFSAAAAYLGLKVGQVFEAAIPIAIIAVGCGNLMKKNNMLGQNVIIQSIGASSGVIVAGAIFTLPALYILGLDAKFYQIFLSSLLGGLLGILMLIPFRKYFEINHNIFTKRMLKTYSYFDILSIFYDNIFVFAIFFVQIYNYQVNSLCNLHNKLQNIKSNKP